MIGILVSGIALAILVDKLTTLHIALIVCGTLTVMVCILSFFGFVRTRKKVLDNEPIDHDKLVRIRNKFGIFMFTVISPLLFATLIIGFYLARQRALEVFVG